MWSWDQGRIRYFQYDAIRAMASYVMESDFRASEASALKKHTGLDFSAPETHSPWRNYSRIYKLCLLLYSDDGVAKPTAVARILSKPGVVTCDEYIHFLVEATTDPSPALSGWSGADLSTKLRSPLCFSLKYILANAVAFNCFNTPINEVLSAYDFSGFIGDESDVDFIDLIVSVRSKGGLSVGSSNKVRQARESIKFISQISYLHSIDNDIFVSLSRDDASEVFSSINPIAGPYEESGDKEIQRISRLFRDGTEHDFFDYASTSLSDVIESGFVEGSKVKKTHVVIERNAKLRSIYFKRHPISVCDSCSMDTKLKYPWVDRVLDLHHVLPLSSGTRVDARKGTMLDDMLPVCPTCHRAIHRYYDNYLRGNNKKDFEHKDEAMDIYIQAKQGISKGDFYV